MCGETWTDASKKSRSLIIEVLLDCGIPISFERYSLTASCDWERVVLVCRAKSVLEKWTICGRVDAVKTDKAAYHPHEHQDRPEDKDRFEP